MVYLQKMMSFFYHIYVGLQEGKEKTTMNLVKDIEGHTGSILDMLKIY